MGVRIITGENEAVLYCSTTMWAFGPVFDDYDAAEAFLQWWRSGDDDRDLRMLTDEELEQVYCEWKRLVEEAEVS